MACKCVFQWFVFAAISTSVCIKNVESVISVMQLWDYICGYQGVFAVKITGLQGFVRHHYVITAFSMQGSVLMHRQTQCRSGLNHATHFSSFFSPFNFGDQVPPPFLLLLPAFPSWPDKCVVEHQSFAWSARAASLLPKCNSLE